MKDNDNGILDRLGVCHRPIHFLDLAGCRSKALDKAESRGFSDVKMPLVRRNIWDGICDCGKATLFEILQGDAEEKARC